MQFYVIFLPIAEYLHNVKLNHVSNNTKRKSQVLLFHCRLYCYDLTKAQIPFSVDETRNW